MGGQESKAGEAQRGGGGAAAAVAAGDDAVAAVAGAAGVAAAAAGAGEGAKGPTHFEKRWGERERKAYIINNEAPSRLQKLSRTVCTALTRARK